MTLPARGTLGSAALVALALLAIGASANHFILPCVEDCAASRWVATGSMASARERHTATLLADGTVLVAGGYGEGSSALADAELYEPGSGAWRAAAPMTVSRLMHTATPLPDGRVLIAGGYAGEGTFPVTASAEVYDPATGTWAATGRMNAPRSWFAATALQDGRVLVAGGWSGLTTLADAEIFDPRTGLWTPTGSLSTARYGHTLTLLADGNVLAVRGSDSDDLETTLSSAELYDIRTGVWTDAGHAVVGSIGHTATLLRDGNVLVAGGYPGGTGSGRGHPDAVMFDPPTRSWTRVGDLAEGRGMHSAVALQDGSVLVAGGFYFWGPYARPLYDFRFSSERFDPATRTWRRAADLVTARAHAQLTLLRDGTALTSGGAVAVGDSQSLVTRRFASTERYVPSARAANEGHGPSEPWWIRPAPGVR